MTETTSALNQKVAFTYEGRRQAQQTVVEQFELQSSCLPGQIELLERLKH